MGVWANRRSKEQWIESSFVKRTEAHPIRKFGDFRKGCEKRTVLFFCFAAQQLAKGNRKWWMQRTELDGGRISSSNFTPAHSILGSLFTDWLWLTVLERGEGVGQ